MTTFLGIATFVASLAIFARLAGRQHRLLHLFQLEHYEPARLMLWLRRREELLDLHEIAPAALLLGGAIACSVAGLNWLAGALLLTLAPLAALGLADWRREAVKPLVMTGRAKRLLSVALLPPALLSLAALVLAFAGPTAASVAVVAALAAALLAGAPSTLLLANALLAPVQRAINERHVEGARRALREYDPLVIGITGSYGKTTTKFCVGSVLAASRPTLVTPASYNSFLGVVRTINELLEPRHEAFVVEMGMFRRGDIAELCDFTHPKIGVITAIGPMHLERLGSIEAIAQAKGELLDALPPDGHFVTNADDPHCMELARRAHVPVTLFGLHPAAVAGSVAPAPPADLSPTRTTPSPKNQAEVQVLAREVKLADGRTELHLHLDGPASPPTPVSAGLLGRHNVSNLLAAAAVGRVLGIDPATIARGLSGVQAPAHRLQPIHNRAAGIVVIDDAYNSNPEGASAALEVLREHPASRRLLVTPGMVELGELEVEANRRFGEQAGAVCDIAILVGRARTVPIREGLAAAGLGSECVHVVASIAEATALLGRLTRAGDVILFENDLPDTYAESGGASRRAA